MCYVQQQTLAFQATPMASTHMVLKSIPSAKRCTMLPRPESKALPATCGTCYQFSRLFKAVDFECCLVHNFRPRAVVADPCLVLHSILHGSVAVALACSRVLSSDMISMQCWSCQDRAARELRESHSPGNTVGLFNIPILTGQRSTT